MTTYFQEKRNSTTNLHLTTPRYSHPPPTPKSARHSPTTSYYECSLLYKILNKILKSKVPLLSPKFHNLIYTHISPLSLVTYSQHTIYSPSPIPFFLLNSAINSETNYISISIEQRRNKIRRK